jgi:hypothetical protein
LSMAYKVLTYLPYSMSLTISLKACFMSRTLATMMKFVTKLVV